MLEFFVCVCLLTLIRIMYENMEALMKFMRHSSKLKVLLFFSLAVFLLLYYLISSIPEVTVTSVRTIKNDPVWQELSICCIVIASIAAIFINWILIRYLIRGYKIKKQRKKVSDSIQ